MNDSGYAAIALSVLGVICMLVPGGQFISSMLFAMADVVGIASSSAQVSLGVREKDKENIGFGIASVALSAVDLGGIAKSVSTSKRIASLLSDFAEQNGIRNAGPRFCKMLAWILTSPKTLRKISHFPIAH